jgi:HAE1 family hydrophobic/amphiphilic exporter-1
MISSSVRHLLLLAALCGATCSFAAAQTTSATAPDPAQSGAAQTPPTPTGQQPAAPATGAPATAGQQDKDLSQLITAQPRPLPPYPPLTRLGVISTQTLPLSLNEAIRRALANNNDIEVQRNTVRFAESVLRALEGVYDPVFSVTPQISQNITPTRSTLTGAGQSGTVTVTDIQFSPTITKSFSVGGGNYQFFFNNLRETTSSTFQQLSPFYQPQLGVTFTQPLLRNRSIDSNRRQIRIQRKQLDQSDADFRRVTTEVIAQVQRAYWDLVFALRDLDNRKANLELSRQNFRQTEARIAAGAAAPLERAEVQTEMATRESDLLMAAQNVSIAENALKQLILKDPLQPEWSSAIVPTDEPTIESTPVNLADALAEARANRPELRRLKLQQDINQIDLAFYRNQAKPRVDLQATLATTGLAGTPVTAAQPITGGTVVPPGTQVPLIGGDPTTNASAFLLQQINLLRAAQGLPAATVPLVTSQTTTQSVPESLIGGYGRALRNMFNFDTRTVSVGVRIELPFRNRTAEANLAGAEITRAQLEASLRTQEQQVETEVRNAAQAVETARQTVLTARAARENAELQLAGERRLYQVGRSTTFLLFQRENALANARTQELQAQTNYNKALADLQRATSTTIRANNIIIESPVEH